MKPLEKIKVLDLSRVLAGPYCTMLLAELGAEITKVEIPEKGDDARHYGPFVDDVSLYFISINRGKRSISLNLKTEKGKQILKDLIPHFDVVIENFRPGTMEKLGLPYEEIRKINPKIIYASTSGFGHTGPDSKKPAYDMLVQAMGGMISITGWPDSLPTRVGMSIGDIGAALYTAIGITTALYQREITGEGQKVDIGMLDCQLALLENAVVRYQAEGVPPSPIGNRHPTITPFQGFKAKDAHITIPIGNDNMWKKFCKILNKEDLITNPLFDTNKNRTDNRLALMEILEPIIAEKNVDEWIEILEKAELPCSPINTIDKVMELEQVKARKMIVDVEDEKIGKVKVVGNAIKMSSLPEQEYRENAPQIGEHNLSVYRDLLNFTKEEIEILKQEGVI